MAIINVLNCIESTFEIQKNIEKKFSVLHNENMIITKVRHNDRD